MLLHFLPLTISRHRPITTSRLDELTHQLNTAMRLVSMPTAVEPYKNSHCQEGAVVCILQFMAEHDPPIGINREGYRAVTLVQLSQPKSATDRQWAELKALSWPPWKEERTAMDAYITRETHGNSKATATIRQMQDAGYGAGEWEKAASIYAGWDHDLTPTIQRRVLLGTRGIRFRSSAAAWTARIEATRTAQEAWACYEACERSHATFHPDVLLAIFTKLYHEERRKEEVDNEAYSQDITGKDRLLPGDVQEVEPLPPSTHLYTYTSKPVPTVHAFYEQLQQRGIILRGHCLAFVVANAGSLTQGLGYLHDSIDIYPDARALLLPGTEQDVSRLPMPLFASFIELCGRFSKASFRRALPPKLLPSYYPDYLLRVLEHRQLNADLPIIHAVDLLRRRKPLYRPAWNSVLRALGHESSNGNLWTALGTPGRLHSSTPPSAVEEPQKGALLAYSLVRRVLSLMRNLHLDLDIDGFLALCNATENMALGSWPVSACGNRPSDGSSGMT